MGPETLVGFQPVNYGEKTVYAFAYLSVVGPDAGGNTTTTLNVRLGSLDNGQITTFGQGVSLGGYLGYSKMFASTSSVYVITGNGDQYQVLIDRTTGNLTVGQITFATPGRTSILQTPDNSVVSLREPGSVAPMVKVATSKAGPGENANGRRQKLPPAQPLPGRQKRCVPPG